MAEVDVVTPAVPNGGGRPAPPASATDDDSGLFEIVVEQQGACAAFELPPTWCRDVHDIADLTVEVLTPPRAHGGKPRAPIVTFHDIGMNAPMCFGAFFSYCRSSGACPELDTAAVHYHISAPGHVANSAPAKASFEVHHLATAVVGVLQRFGARRVVGVGCGLGAAVLAQAALDAPEHFAGLVAISPVLYAAGLWERTFASADALATSGLGLGRRAKDRFLERWLALVSRERNHDLVQALDEELDRMAPSNVASLVAAEARRPDLTPRLRELPKTMLVTGRESPLRHHVEEAFSLFNPSKVTWLDVMDYGSLVHEEAPERVAKALALYLQGFGEYIE